MNLVIIEYPNDWIPELWTDNPPSGIVRHILPLEEPDAYDAIAGFNKGELVNPKGIWAIATHTPSQIGEQVGIDSILERN